jgi:uncharacterized protein (TIGR02118 family)
MDVVDVFRFLNRLEVMLFSGAACRSKVSEIRPRSCGNAVLDLKRKALCDFQLHLKPLSCPGIRSNCHSSASATERVSPAEWSGIATQWELSQVLSREEHRMSDAKLMAMYPLPKNVHAFKKIYQNEHVPLAVAKLGGKTKIVATKILGSPQGIAPFYPIAQVYFPSMQALEGCAASYGGKKAIAHTVKISSGGVPIFLVAGEETIMSTETVNA